ncbi:uncharacterized protein LOC105631226 isoform X2 [Jatropha curcas]|uniref:uncharacterized protein LOC105631226 isoform X2 n=1 Tax=Jatropha curcas TaxID=180498 RepID=UPI0005FACB7A|nr:uncharacterized protein LOC105631226 isoform X2 [Jatropha curcas]
MSSSSLLISRATITSLFQSPSSSSSSPSKSSIFQFCPSSSSSRRRCLLLVRASKSTNFEFVLHDALDSCGVDATHAREARKGFLTQIQNLSDIERGTSISINRCVDLGKMALYIAAEDDSLLSNSSIPLPVDHFIEILDNISMDYCSSYRSSFRSSPEKFLDSLDTYLYVKKGFRRTAPSPKDQLDIRPLYLPSVLINRSGSAVMLSLIYSEILKMLRLWGLLDFDCEIFFPHDLHSLPRGYHKQKGKESDQQHIMTTQSLLEETLRSLKEAFWPFQYDHTKSLFLRAAHATNCIDVSKHLEYCGSQLLPAKAADNRIHHALQTSTHFGDMRLALSACERLILLRSNPKELRDYSILLYHCGFYEQSRQYLKLYQEKKNFSLQKQISSEYDNLEEDAVEKLMVRLCLISMEKGDIASIANPHFCVQMS